MVRGGPERRQPPGSPQPPQKPPASYLYLVSRPMNCTMQRRVITVGRDRRCRGGWGAGTGTPQGDAGVTGGHHPRHQAHTPATGGVPTVKGVGDECGGGASDHLSGGLGRNVLSGGGCWEGR